MNGEELRTLIASRRAEIGITQAELARLAQVSREMVVRFENGAHDIGLRRLLRLCDALGLELSIRPGQGRPVLEELGALFGDDE
jgi:transcriptional regulator with XRE-family HTH domain